MVTIRGRPLIIWRGRGADFRDIHIQGTVFAARAASAARAACAAHATFIILHGLSVVAGAALAAQAALTALAAQAAWAALAAKTVPWLILFHEGSFGPHPPDN